MGAPNPYASTAAPVPGRSPVRPSPAASLGHCQKQAKDIQLSMVETIGRKGSQQANGSKLRRAFSLLSPSCCQRLLYLA